MGALPGPGSLSQGSDTILSDARANAEASLRAAYPGQNVQMPGAGGSTSTSVGVDTGSPSPDSYTAEPPDDAVPMSDVMPVNDKGPPKDATPMKPPREHEAWSWSNMRDFVRDETKGTPEELLKGIPRFIANTNNNANRVGLGAVAAVADKVADLITGRKGHSESQDKVFDYTEKYIQPAIEKRLTPQRAEVTGQDEGSGGFAQAVGQGTEAVGAMVSGPIGALSLVGNSGLDTTRQAIDKGHSLKTAAAEGAVDSIVTALQMLIPGHNLTLAKRVLVQVPAGDFAATAGAFAKKKVLESAGHQKEADEIDPVREGFSGENTLQNIVFAVLGGKKKDKSGVTPPPDAEPMPAAGSPPPDAVPMPAAQQPAPPPVSAQATPAPVVSQAPVAAPVKDIPSAEPIKDLRAQFLDMNDPKTPRKGVLLSKDNLANLTATKDTNASAETVLRQLEQARKTGRVVDTPQGALVAKNKAEALKAQERLKKGEDPQSVIGDLTGAGTGKTPDQTHVVQGHTPDGAVASESMVTPAEIPAKVAEVQAQGKAPVITTPDAAVQRRAAEIAREVPNTLATPPEGVPGRHPGENDAHYAERVSKTLPAEKPVADEKAKPVTEEKPSDEDVEEEGPPVQRGIIKTGGGDRAVVIHDATPDAEGKIRVSPLDKAGEPGPEIRVPAESLRGSSSSDSSPAKVVESKPAPAAAEPRSSPPLPEGGGSATVEPPTKKPAKSAPAVEQLADAATDFERSQQAPKGKKFPGSVKDRAGSVANFARVLKGVAQSMTGKAPVTDIQHAIEVAKKAEKLDYKSDESMAKNQGVGHTELATHADNLLNAARKLMDPDFVRPEPKSSVQEKMKAKQAAKKATPAKADRTVSPEIEAQNRHQRSLPPLAEPIHLDEAGQQKIGESLVELNRGHETERPGDVMQASGKYQDFDKVVAVVKREVEAGRLNPWPAQLGEELGIAARDWRRVLEGAGYDTTRWYGPPKEKLAELTTQVVKEREAAKKPKAAEPEKVKVIADVEDETKPKVLTPAQQRQLKAAGDKLLKAKDEDADAHRADVEKLIKEVYGHRMDDETRVAFMDSLERERVERKRPKSRDDEIEDEFSDHRHEDGTEELETKSLSPHDISPEMARLHANLEKSGMFPKMRELAKAGGNMQFNGRKLLEHMASNTPAGPLRDFMAKLAAHLPAETAVVPVSNITSLSGEHMNSAAGLFTRNDNRVQILMKGPGDSRLTHAVLHELVHAATAHLAAADPSHPFVRETKRLRQIFENRLRAKYGDAVIQAHLDGTGVVRDLYGLKNHLEFMAEAMSNPKFQQLIAASEKFRQPGEGFIGGVHKLADAVVGAIRRALNIVSNRESKLLHAVMRNVEDVMEAQKTQLDAASGPEAADAFHSLAVLDGDPKPLREEGRIRSIVGDKAADTTRQFYRATQGRAVPATRKLVLMNKTHDQIVRDEAHWFGKDDAKNPLRQWDAIQQEKTEIQNEILERGRDHVINRQRLARDEDGKLGRFQIDSTTWGMDPDVDKANMPKKTQGLPNFDARHEDFMKRWNALSEPAKAVYRGEREFYKWGNNRLRKAGVDAALDTFSDRDITEAQRSLLYSVRTKGDFDGLIGSGKLIDVGDRNEGLRKSLQELAGLNQVAGPYFHLGRHGEYVVQVHPEGTKEFGSKAEAEAYAEKVRDFGPGSKAKVQELGGKWTVDYKAQHVSMHETKGDAEDAADLLRAQGHKVGQVTTKIEASSGGALSAGMETLVAEASRKIARRGDGKDAPEVKALTDALRGTFVQMVAARSAYAASKLARKGFAGVKPEEMGRNFASHAQSMAWNIGNLATTFKQGEALGRIREAAKSPEENVPQVTVYKRGAVMRELGKRTAQEVSQYGIKNPASAVASKLGYMNFLASPAHTIVNMTQNFTTAIPVAGPKWGYGKTMVAFGKATRMIAGPTFRAAMKAHLPGKFNAEDMAGAVIKAVAKDPQLGKWAPHLKQLMDRGVISSTFASELGHVGQGANPTLQRAFDYARILPQMAEVYNRVSTALAGLELSGGDMIKTADFVRESHVDYTQSNKTRTAKFVAKVPGGNTLTMFRTYIQGMRHLLYSNVKNMVFAETKSRGEAAKTVAGLILAQSMFAGVVKGALIEPLRLAVYAYNQIFNDEDEYFDLDNATRRFVSDAVGNKTIADAITGGLPHLLGFDLSSRMGLSDLFLHDPPDLWHADSKQLMQFLGTQLGGPMGQMVAAHKDEFIDAMDRGDTYGMLTSVIPIKLLRDIGKAFDLGSTGKRAGNGGQLTDPSTVNAAFQAVGLKPAEVQRVQERQGTAAQYHEFTQGRKARLLKAYAATDDKAEVQDQIDAYNAANPGNRITYMDKRRQQRGAAAATNTANEGYERNPKTRELLDY